MELVASKSYSSHANKLEAPVICKTNAKRSVLPNWEQLPNMICPPNCCENRAVQVASSSIEGLAPLVGGGEVHRFELYYFIICQLLLRRSR